jgi:hypothetical protein
VFNKRNDSSTIGTRCRDVAEFWRALPFVMEKTGETEEQILARFPSMRGTRPPARPIARVIVMPVRDGKKAAAGDRDDFDDAA